MLITSMDANLELLTFLVKDLLKGDEDDLIPDFEQLAAAIDEVLYRTGIMAAETLEALNRYAPGLPVAQVEQFAALTRRYCETTDRWEQVCEAVHGVWKMRMPPH